MGKLRTPQKKIIPFVKNVLQMETREKKKSEIARACVCVCAMKKKKKRWLLSREATSKANYLFFFSFPLISKQLLDTENNKNKTEQTNKQQQKRELATLRGKKKATGWQVSHLSITKEKKEEKQLN